MKVKKLIKPRQTIFEGGIVNGRKGKFYFDYFLQEKTFIYRLSIWEVFKLFFKPLKIKNNNEININI